jgi:hypothetical protein
VIFDSNAYQIQAAEHVIACLLKQALTNFGDVPPELVDFHDGYASKGKRLDQTTLLQYLTTCSEKFSTVYAVFDALDEYSESCQTTLFKLFGTLQQSGYRLLVSFRPHLSKLFQNVLSDPQILEVRADELDLEKYVAVRLEEKGNKISELKDRCLQLTKGLDGV